MGDRLVDRLRTLGWVLLLLAPILPPSATPAQEAADGSGGVTLVVTADGLESDAGSVAFALFDSAESFLETPLRKARLETSDGRCTWTVEDLPPGDYGVSVYHDLNGNGELDKRAFGLPKEPYGFSNDAPLRMGPPAWKDARFTVGDEDLEIRVKMR